MARARELRVTDIPAFRSYAKSSFSILSENCPVPCVCGVHDVRDTLRGVARSVRGVRAEERICHGFDLASNAALSGRGPREHQETPWPVPAVRLNA